MPSLTLKTIDFHNQQLLTFEKDGVFYTAMKPICENIGLDWTAQRQRINRDEVLSQGTVMITTPTKGGEQEMLCLPIQYLNGWLFGVDVSRVKAEIKDKIIMYKKECYQVLHDYWNKGVAINPRRVTISIKQQSIIRMAVKKRCKVDSVHYATVYEAIKEHFGIPRYSELLASDFDECMLLIENIQLPQAIEHQPFNIGDYLNPQVNQIMDYVHGLEHIVFNTTGKYPQRPFSKDEIAKGIIGYCLRNQTIELNFSERGLGFNLVDRTTLRIHDSNIAEHIKMGNVSKQYLDEIIQASVARLS